MNQIDAETRAMALIGMSLSQSLLSLLGAKGVLTNDQVDQLLEGLLIGFESRLSPQDDGAQQARKIVENLAAVVAQSRRNAAK